MPGANAGTQLLDRIKEFVIDPILMVIFSLGLLLFLWGIVEFLLAVKDGKPSDEGKRHMVWGLIGMLIMVSVYGIINLVVNSLDLRDATDVGRIKNVNPGINFQ